MGSILNFTAGYQIKNDVERVYAGANMAYGSFYNFGYVSGNVQYGTFFRSGVSEQSVVAAGINYFTPILKLGRWHFRQFVKPQITIGINRYPLDGIALDNDNGIKGFGSSALTGTKKAVFTLQSRFYAPWSIIGFRFSPYVVYSSGIVGNDEIGFRKSKLYQVFAMGFLIKNDYLVLNTIEVSFAFYPTIPTLFNFNPRRGRALVRLDYILSFYRSEDCRG